MSMSFMPQRYDAAREHTMCVFTDAETREGAWDEASDRLIPNPAYRPELELNLSNASAIALLAALGVAVEDGLAVVAIDRFIALCEQWLKRHIGRPSAEIETRVERGAGGCTVVDCGRPAGHLNALILRVSRIAREGKARGATEMVAA